MALLKLSREINKLFEAPSLRAVLIAITIYWLGYSYYPFLKDPTINIQTLLLLLMWLLLFSGMLAKIKGFKITNGIVSTCIFILSIYSLSLVAEAWIDTPYAAYITLMNKQFAALYKNKEDISLYRRRFFQFSLAIFVILLIILTVYDLHYLGVFKRLGL